MAKWQQPRSFWTWGYRSDEPTQDERNAAAARVSERLGRAVVPPPVPDINDITLRPPRIQVPSRLDWVSQNHVERVMHTHGGHPLEMLTAMRGEFAEPPDAVAHPRTDAELEATLEWCDTNGVTAIPYGGGTTVVWGVNVPNWTDAALTIDMDHFSSILEIDHTSRAIRVQAGMLGPDLEAALKPEGLTLRHFPQSFPWSTVGGWVATRSGGHYATNHTHIDDFVESTRMLTPQGWWESRRLPGSGAGPSPDRLVLGSEGILGVISECWLRVQKRPRFRATAGVVFASWEAGYTACRHIVQAKQWPANLRLLDPLEARMSAGLDGSHALLIIGFESADLSQRSEIADAVAIAREHGGEVAIDAILIDDGTGQETGRAGPVGAWRNAFIGVNAGATNGLGLLSDTFETAITWDQWPEFDAHIRAEVGRALQSALGHGHTLSCRFTHVYPDGPAPYYSFSGVAQEGGEWSQWGEIKAAATEAILTAGGTVTHHHAVGRMHADGWSRQRPALFGDALRAVKQQVDPNGILNPGVLF